MLLQPDTLLQGRYRVVRLIAQGGMGAVYQATDERLGNTVALKQTLMVDPKLRAAFEREARLLAGLHHPALPVVSDHFDEDGGQFLVMQFIPGDDLAQLLRRRGGPFPLAEALPWADRLLDALDYLHSRTPPIVHRDVKPLNLKLTARGELVLLDFGLAKGAPAGATAANPSLLGYTPQYAPLEQIQGSGTDARSDLYSVGATLYELLTGTVPADALSRAAAAVQGAPDPLRPAHELAPQLPPALSDLLARALALNPALRPPSAAAMRDAMHDAALGKPSPVTSQPTPSVNSAGQATVAVNARTQQPAPIVAGPKVTPVTWLIAGGLALLAIVIAVMAALPGPKVAGSGAAVEPPSALTAIAAVGGLGDVVSSGSSTEIDGGLPDPGGARGSTRDNPLPLGTRMLVDGWMVEVTQIIRGDQADERVRRANSNNDIPGEDEEYLLLYVRATSAASADQFAFSQSDVSVVGSRDIVYRGYGAVAPSPRLDSTEQIPPGGVVEGWAAYMVGREELDLVVVAGDLLADDARLMSLTPGARLEPDVDALGVAPNRVGEDIREPAGVGETAITEDWAITITELFVGDDAWQRIREYHRSSEPPQAGMQYVLFFVEARFLGSDDVPDLIADNHFIGMAGDQEVEQPVILVPDNELFGVLYPGGRAEGWVAVMLPADETARIAFRAAGISFGNRDGWRYFILP
jgi:hypothetical protein